MEELDVLVLGAELLEAVVEILTTKVGGRRRQCKRPSSRKVQVCSGSRCSNDPSENTNSIRRPKLLRK